MEERRRFTRRAPRRETATVQTTLDVRVLEISVSGALLHSSRPVEPGARARLRLNLDGTPFLADVVIRRVTAAVEGSVGFRLGAEFTGIAPDARRLMEVFISGQ